MRAALGTSAIALSAPTRIGPQRAMARAQRILAISSDERYPDRPADIRIADAAGEFFRQPQGSQLRLAWPVRHGLFQNLDRLPTEPDQHQPQSKPAAELADLGPLRRESPAAP